MTGAPHERYCVSSLIPCSNAVSQTNFHATKLFHSKSQEHFFFPLLLVPVHAYSMDTTTLIPIFVKSEVSQRFKHMLVHLQYALVYLCRC